MLNSKVAGMVVLLVRKDWEALTKSCSLGLLSVVIQPYLQFYPTVTQNQVISQQAKGFVSLK